jgi:cytochrome b561
MVQRWLHWMIAALVSAMIGLGAATTATIDATRSDLAAWHRTLGLALLVLGIVRLGVRLRRRPLPNPHLGRMEARGAAVVHAALYALVIAMPLVGWAADSAGGYPLELIGGWRAPALIGEDLERFAVLRMAHRVAGYLVFALVLLHVTGVLTHALVKRNGTLRRMRSG